MLRARWVTCRHISPYHIRHSTPRRSVALRGRDGRLARTCSRWDAAPVADSAVAASGAVLLVLGEPLEIPPVRRDRDSNEHHRIGRGSFGRSFRCSKSVQGVAHGQRFFAAQVGQHFPLRCPNAPRLRRIAGLRFPRPCWGRALHPQRFRQTPNQICRLAQHPGGVERPIASQLGVGLNVVRSLDVQLG